MGTSSYLHFPTISCYKLEFCIERRFAKNCYSSNKVRNTSSTYKCWMQDWLQYICTFRNTDLHWIDEGEYTRELPKLYFSQSTKVEHFDDYWRKIPELLMYLSHFYFLSSNSLKIVILSNDLFYIPNNRGENLIGFWKFFFVNIFSPTQMKKVPTYILH